MIRGFVEAEEPDLLVVVLVVVAVDAGADPRVFVPLVDFDKLEDPSIIEALEIADALGDVEVAEVEDPTVTKSLQAAGKAAGFRTKRPVVELLGTCANCADKRA